MGEPEKMEEEQGERESYCRGRRAEIGCSNWIEKHEIRFRGEVERQNGPALSTNLGIVLLPGRAAGLWTRHASREELCSGALNQNSVGFCIAGYSLRLFLFRDCRRFRA